MSVILFNSIEALQFTPRLKGVLSRVLPILGNVRDAQRPIFANGVVKFLTSWVGQSISDAKSRKCLSSWFIFCNLLLYLGSVSSGVFNKDWSEWLLCSGTGQTYITCASCRLHWLGSLHYINGYLTLYQVKREKKKVDFILAFGVSHQNKLSKKILYILFKSKNKFDLYVIDLNCLCLFWRRLMLLKEKIIY